MNVLTVRAVNLTLGCHICGKTAHLPVASVALMGLWKDAHRAPYTASWDVELVPEAPTGDNGSDPDRRRGS